MPRATTLYTNFTGGQISDDLDGRVDTNIYQNGAKLLENFLVTPQGSAKRRQGTRFVSEVKNSSKKTRLIPFEFSNEQTYILEFGDLYIRFYTNQGQILSGGSPYEIASPYTEDNVFNIRFAQNKDIMYLVDGANTIRKLSRFSDTNWVLSEVEITDTPLLSINPDTEEGGEVIANGEFTSVLTPWTDVSAGSSTATIVSDELSLTVVGTDDARARQTLNIIEPSREHIFTLEVTSGTNVRVIIGTTPGGSDIFGSLMASGVNTFTITAPGASTIYIDIYKDGAAGAGTATADNCSLRPSGKFLRLITAGSWGAGQSMTMQANGHFPFQSGHVGSVWRLTDDPAVATPQSVRVEIISYTDSDTVTVTPFEDVPVNLQGPATPYWQEGAWSDVQGYPKIVTLFEQRLIFANTTNQPQTIWFSVSGVFETFTEGINADDGFNRTIASNQVNIIEWIAEAKDVLVVGTSGGEFIMTGGGENDAFTPANIAIRRQTNYGCAFVEPINSDGAIIFAQRNARIMRLFGYTLEQDGYLGDDATIYSTDILGTGVKQMDFQKKKSRIVWCVLNDGDIATLTYEPSQQVRAWEKQTTEGEFESVSVIDGDDADEVWVVVKRNINGSDVRYVEFFEPETNDVFMVDSGLEYNGVATQSISGLTHLANETVDIWNNGAAEGQKTVSATGTLTLDTETTNAIIGLPYSSLFRTRRAEVAAANGPAQGKPKTIYKFIIRILNSLGGEYSNDGTNWYEFEWRDMDNNMDEAIPYLTGDAEIISPNGWERKGDLYIRQMQPLPFNIQLLHLMIITNDT